MNELMKGALPNIVAAIGHTPIVKLHTVAREKIRETIGPINFEHLIEIERAVAVWLGIAD